MSWYRVGLPFLAVFGVFIVGVPVGLLVHDLYRMIAERRQNRRWLKHCKHCVYFRRIQFTSLDSFHRRGVVCDTGLDFEYVQDPMKCGRFKPLPSDILL